MTSCFRILLTSAVAIGSLVASLSTSAAGPMSLPKLDSFWNYSDPAESEANFREAVTEAHKAGELAYEMEASTQLARTLGLQHRFDEAQALLDEIKPRLTDEMAVARTRWQLEQGRVLNSSGNPRASIPYFETALGIAEADGFDYLAIDAAHMLGIVEEHDAAIRWNEKAIAMTEATADEASKHWLGPLRNNLGWTYFDMGEYGKALALFEKDYEFRTGRDRPFEAGIALWSRAKMLRMLGRVEEALEIQRGLADDPLRKGRPAEGYTHEEIGECLMSLGRGEEAKSHFAIAYDRLKDDPWLRAEEQQRLDRLKALSR